MAQDIRPFRSGAFALLLLAAAVFAAGIWTELRGPSADPAARLMADVVAPLMQGGLPAFLPSSQTAFGTFANIGGVIALAGLLLFTLRRTAPPAPAAPAIPRIVPRRPSDLRAARSGVTAPALTAAEAPAEAAPPATRRAGLTFQRGALMLIGSALIGIGAIFAFGRANLPVPAFTAPDAMQFGMRDLVGPALVAFAGTLFVVIVLRRIRSRRAAA